ncbi:MAG: hypothetical protein ACE15F_01220 [bacterium]
MFKSLSFRIQQRLVEKIAACHGDPSDIRHRVREGESNLMDVIAREVDAIYPDVIAELMALPQGENPAVLYEASGQTLFSQRVKAGVIEAIYGEPLSPLLLILPEPSGAIRPRDNPFAGPVHAVCVEYLPNFANELYPLLVDAYIDDLSRPDSSRTPVAGVHVSWLDDKLRARRAIYYRPDENELIETSLVPPVEIESVHFLAVSPSCHQLYSERFTRRGIPPLNPYAASMRADDKYGCFLEWRKNGVPTPEAVLIPRSEARDAPAARKRIEAAFPVLFGPEPKDEVLLMVQPNRGTEGRGIRAFRGPGSWPGMAGRHPDILEHVRRIASGDDVLLRQGVGNLLMHDAIHRKNVCFDIRLNVAAGRVESGYLMAAAPGEIVTSPTAGGRILEWKQPQRPPVDVMGPAGGLAWNAEAWQVIERAAETAAACFPECRLVGVDARLEWAGGQLIPWILDINPRPAGLAHSRYFATGEPGVTQRLWQDLHNLRKRSGEGT